MKKQIVVAGAALGLALSGASFAATTSTSAQSTGYFANVSGGYNIVGGYYGSDDAVNLNGKFKASDKLDNGYDLGVAVGKSINDNVSVDASFTFLANNQKDNDDNTGPRSLVYMVDGVYHFNMNSPITPYVGAGMGLVNTYHVTEGDVDYGSVREFGYQAIAGVSYALNDKINLNANYRFITTINQQGTDSETLADATSNETVYTPYRSLLNVGVTYRF